MEKSQTREFAILGVQHDFGGVRKTRGIARVQIESQEQLGIPIVRTMVTFKFEGRSVKSELTEVVGDTSGTPVELIVRRGWDRRESYSLFLNPAAMSEAQENHKKRKEEYRINAEELRWSDNHPARTRKEAVMPFEERRRLTPKA